VTNKAGQTFDNSGISVLTIRWGKVVEMQDFYFDVETLHKMYGE